MVQALLHPNNHKDPNGGLPKLLLLGSWPKGRVPPCTVLSDKWNFLQFSAEWKLLHVLIRTGTLPQHAHVCCVAVGPLSVSS